MSAAYIECQNKSTRTYRFRLGVISQIYRPAGGRRRPAEIRAFEEALMAVVGSGSLEQRCAEMHFDPAVRGRRFALGPIVVRPIVARPTVVRPIATAFGQQVAKGGRGLRVGGIC